MREPQRRKRKRRWFRSCAAGQHTTYACAATATSRVERVPFAGYAERKMQRSQSGESGQGAGGAEGSSSRGNTWQPLVSVQHGSATLAHRPAPPKHRRKGCCRQLSMLSYILTALQTMCPKVTSGCKSWLELMQHVIDRAERNSSLCSVEQYSMRKHSQQHVGCSTALTERLRRGWRWRLRTIDARLSLHQPGRPARQRCRRRCRDYHNVTKQISCATTCTLQCETPCCSPHAIFLHARGCASGPTPKLSDMALLRYSCCVGAASH